MEIGYHNSSFRYPDDPEKSMTDALVDRARWVESAGFTWFSVMDHVWQLPFNGQRDEQFLECYTALTAVARGTNAIDLGALVTCPHYRNPAYLGRVVASLDAVSDGRAVLGIGAGWYEDEYDAMDIDFPDISTRNRQMREAIEICEALWSRESPVSYDGDHYTVDEFFCDPKPEDVPVLVGGGGEQLTLRATAEYADRWNVPSGDPDTFADKLAVLRDHCETAEADYDAITKTIGNTTVIRETTEAAHDAYERLTGQTEAGPTPREEDRGVVGTPAEAAQRIRAFDEAGADQFILIVPANDRRTVELFLDEVMDEVA